VEDGRRGPGLAQCRSLHYLRWGSLLWRHAGPGCGRRGSGPRWRARTVDCHPNV